MKSSDLLLDIKKDIFYRAKLFIDDMGEFAPFGSELIEGKIKPIVIYDDSENIIKGLKLVEILKNNLSEKILRNSINAGAIAYDVYINVNVNNEKEVRRNALCLEISTTGKHWDKDYYLYKIVNKKCVWG